MGVVRIFSTSGNETTTLGNDVEVVIGIRIVHVTLAEFDVHVVPTVSVTDGSVSEVSF